MWTQKAQLADILKQPGDEDGQTRGYQMLDLNRYIREGKEWWNGQACRDLLKGYEYYA